VLNHAAQPHREIIDTLLRFARGILKLPKQLLCRGCPHVVFANPKVLITFDASFTLSLLTTADTISGGTALDNTSSAIMSAEHRRRSPPSTKGLYFHQRPVRLICFGYGGVATPYSNHTYYLLDDAAAGAYALAVASA
jgi:hypothetical protein